MQQNHYILTVRRPIITRVVGCYCWWTKSCTTKDDDYRVLTIPGGAGFLPSTVPVLFCRGVATQQLDPCFDNSRGAFLRPLHILRLSFVVAEIYKKLLDLYTVCWVSWAPNKKGNSWPWREWLIISSASSLRLFLPCNCVYLVHLPIAIKHCWQVSYHTFHFFTRSPTYIAWNYSDVRSPTYTLGTTQTY